MNFPGVNAEEFDVLEGVDVLLGGVALPLDLQGAHFPMRACLPSSPMRALDITPALYHSMACIIRVGERHGRSLDEFDDVNDELARDQPALAAC